MDFVPLGRIPIENRGPKGHARQYITVKGAEESSLT